MNKELLPINDMVRIIVEGPQDLSTGNIANGVVVTKFIKREEELSFEDIVTIAKENGFSYGSFFLFLESAREGKIYRYEEFEGETPMWFEIGTTIGYA